MTKRMPRAVILSGTVAVVSGVGVGAIIITVFAQTAQSYGIWVFVACMAGAILVANMVALYAFKRMARKLPTVSKYLKEWERRHAKRKQNEKD